MRNEKINEMGKLTCQREIRVREVRIDRMKEGKQFWKGCGIWGKVIFERLWSFWGPKSCWRSINERCIRMYCECWYNVLNVWGWDWYWDWHWIIVIKKKSQDSYHSIWCYVIGSRPWRFFCWVPEICGLERTPFVRRLETFWSGVRLCWKISHFPCEVIDEEGEGKKEFECRK
jgi:hypothetical protein